MRQATSAPSSMKSSSIKYVAMSRKGLKRREARVVIGGLPPKEGPLSEGYYAIPTVFANVANDWRLAREEIFGPVLVAIPWTDEADAIRMANDSHYGLAAYVWSHDLGRALRAPHAIEAGWGQVNQGLGTLVLRHLFLLRRRIGGTRAKRSILSVIVPADGTSAATV